MEPLYIICMQTVEFVVLDLSYESQKLDFKRVK